ncbi:hypothetical protein CAPTEDRAFT_57286, partial [Capitella teleta]
GDSVDYSNGFKFSTRNQDNEADPRDCPYLNKGGWWFRGCHYGNLNGLYLNRSYRRRHGFEWFNWKLASYPLQITEIKMRP